MNRVIRPDSFEDRIFRTSKEGGFVLIATALSILCILGMLGLVIDLGRAYVVKNEAQAFTDAASLAAARELDNTLAGISEARSAVTNSSNKWYFGAKQYTSTVTEFSTDKTNWSQSPVSATDVKYVRVTVPNNSLAVYFMTSLGAPKSLAVAARSVAGMETPTTFPQGVFPFAPFAHSPAGPNFGYAKYDELTLLWPSSVNSNGQKTKMSNLCTSDQNPEALDLVTSGTIAERGYIQEPSADAIAAAIEDDHMDYTVTLGQPVQRTGGVKTTDVYQSLEDRVDQDTMPNQSNYDSYIAGHDSTPMRRVVIVPIIGDPVNAVVLGFAKVFLPPRQPHNPNNAKCAMYIGPADAPAGDGATGANVLRLVE